MIKLYENGVYLLNGTEIVEDNGSAQFPISKEEAAKNTMAYEMCIRDRYISFCTY